LTTEMQQTINNCLPLPWRCRSAEPNSLEFVVAFHIVDGLTMRYNCRMAY
jgi:hypothetical protein